MRVDSERGSFVPTFVEIQPDTRQRIEAAIERLIEVLDFIDGEPDLEPDSDDEPSLAAPTGGENQTIWCAGPDDDREQDVHPVDWRVP